MAADTNTTRSVRVPGGCLPAAAGAMGFWVMWAVWGPWKVLPGLLLGAGATLALRWRWRRWFPHRATRELNKVIANIPGRARVVRRKCRRKGRYQWDIAWKVPTGVTVPGLKRLIPVFEVALDCSCDFWHSKGYVWMRAGTAQLPEEIRFEEFYR